MEYKRFDNMIAVRLDPGDEICTSLTKLAEDEDIRFAAVSGLGAVSSFAIGVFDTAEKTYYENKFEGIYEITSLLGTLSRKDGQPYLHLHMNAGDRSGVVFGGHLTKAVIGVTGEILLRCIDGEVNRRMSEEIGIHQMIF